MSQKELFNQCLNEPSAVQFCELFFGACQVVDDLVDRDNQVTNDDIYRMFLSLIIELPRNKFYRVHIDYLTPVINHVIHDWIDANRMEKGEEQEQRVAYVLRDTYNSILSHCAYLLYGQDKMNEVNKIVREIVFTEAFKDYQEGLNHG